MAFSGHDRRPRDDRRDDWRYDDRLARDDRTSRSSGDFDRRPHASYGDRGRSRSRSRSRSPRRSSPSHATSAPPPRPWATPPSATLIIRGLTTNVSDPMLLHALAPFRPTSVRVMFHKATGEHRRFAFANFDSVHAATAVMDAFASQPLIIDNQPAILAYAEQNRPNPHAQRFNNGDSGAPPSFNGGPPRLDWICDQCGGSNFSRRTECFKCHMPKSQFAMEVPPRTGPTPHSNMGPPHFPGTDFRGPMGHSEFDGPRQYHDDPGRRDAREMEMEEPPSHVLAVRMIPLDVDEGELQVVFAQFEGVRDIRLIRDRATNQSRGFAFVEFGDIESAQRVRSNGLAIRGEMVRVGFARETLQIRPPSARTAGGFERPVPMNPIAAAALEQAQWAMANNYGAIHQTATADDTPAEPTVNLDDIDTLLNNAAAAARPHIEEPKKQWPLPFETGGGMYVYKSDCGLYYDTDSMFYYDPHSKIYYSSFTGQYFRCPNGSQGAGATFEAFTPPPPADEATFNPEQTQLSGPAKPVVLSLAGKKKPAISFSLKMPNAIASGKTGSVFAAETAAGPSTTAAHAPLGSGVSMAAAASASVRKKSALDIAKWSQRQVEESKATIPALSPQPAPAQRPPAATIPVTVATSAAAVDIPLEAPICLLCRRKFGSMEQLRKHETQSKLHADNLAKAKQDKDIVAAQIRERDDEERDEQQPKRKRQRPGDAVSTKPVDAQPAPVPPASESASAAPLESGIGGKMLKMMGWKKGKGLGKHGTGITAPVEATGNVGSETTGLGAKTTPAINVADVASYKERLQKMARARYDAADVHDTKTL